MGTKTFAARAEVEGLAAARAEVAVAEPSTRRMASSAPNAANAPDSDRGVTGAAAKPLEAPSRRPGSARPRRGTARAAWLGMAGAGILATGAFFLGRGAASAPVNRPGPGESAGSAAHAPDPARAMRLAAPSNAASDGTGGDPPPAPPAPAPTAADRPVAPASAAAVTGPAQLVLLGEGTTVRVDGVARGTSPARVSVDPGTHSVVFGFPATGETKTASVSVRSGERATLRADFTGAAPAIRVER